MRITSAVAFVLGLSIESSAAMGASSPSTPPQPPTPVAELIQLKCTFDYPKIEPNAEQSLRYKRYQVRTTDSFGYLIDAIKNLFVKEADDPSPDISRGVLDSSSQDNKADLQTAIFVIDLTNKTVRSHAGLSSKVPIYANLNDGNAFPIPELLRVSTSSGIDASIKEYVDIQDYYIYFGEFACSPHDKRQESQYIFGNPSPLRILGHEDSCQSNYTSNIHDFRISRFDGSASYRFFDQKEISGHCEKDDSKPEF